MILHVSVFERQTDAIVSLKLQNAMLQNEMDTMSTKFVNQEHQSKVDIKAFNMKLGVMKFQTDQQLESQEAIIKSQTLQLANQGADLKKTEEELSKHKEREQVLIHELNGVKAKAARDHAQNKIKYCYFGEQYQTSVRRSASNPN